MPAVLRIMHIVSFSLVMKEMNRLYTFESGDGYCKFWIKPVSLAYSTGYHSAELNKIRKLVEKKFKRNREKLE